MPPLAGHWSTPLLLLLFFGVLFPRLRLFVLLRQGAAFRANPPTRQAKRRRHPPTQLRRCCGSKKTRTTLLNGRARVIAKAAGKAAVKTNRQKKRISGPA